MSDPATEDLRLRLIQAAKNSGMTHEEALRAAQDSIDRRDWRARRGVKECQGCGHDKKIQEFGKDSRERDGLNRLCRVCIARRNSRLRRK